METIMQRITPHDLARLTVLARKHHRTNVEEISALLDEIEARETIHIPAIEFTGKGDEIGKAFTKEIMEAQNE